MKTVRIEMKPFLKWLLELKQFCKVGIYVVAATALWQIMVNTEGIKWFDIAIYITAPFFMLMYYMVTDYVSVLKSKQEKNAEPAKKRTLHFARPSTDAERKTLFNRLVKGGFISKNTDYDHFTYVFGGGNVPDGFKPLQWLATIKELHYFISRHLPKESNRWEKAVNCFEKDNKPIKIRSLSTAMDKYDIEPETSTEIDSMLS